MPSGCRKPGYPGDVCRAFRTALKHGGRGGGMNGKLRIKHRGRAPRPDNRPRSAGFCLAGHSVCLPVVGGA
ncbi:hypothetical protein KCP75_10345 [Salmonella enterica subsp. enterica]|nr:hypothetical protein KCP75_10345 [Salmonella enterica subsp. enterica]